MIFNNTTVQLDYHGFELEEVRRVLGAPVTILSESDKKAIFIKIIADTVYVINQKEAQRILNDKSAEIYQISK